MTSEVSSPQPPTPSTSYPLRSDASTTSLRTMSNTTYPVEPAEIAETLTEKGFMPAADDPENTPERRFSNAMDSLVDVPAQQPQPENGKRHSLQPLYRRLKPVAKPMTISATILLIVLWATALWVFGCVHEAGKRAHKLKVRVRDFDGGVVGAALVDTLHPLNGDAEKPTFVFTNGSLEEVIKSVHDGHYWGALIAHAGATDRLNAALADPEAGYDPKAAYTSVLASARYFTTYSIFVRPTVTIALITAGAKASAYAALQALQKVGNGGAMSSTRAQALAVVIAQGAGYTEHELAPFPFQSRIFVNTIGVVVPNLGTFFMNMIVLAGFTAAGVYTHPPGWFALARVKFAIKATWCVVLGLVCASVNFTYRESYTYPAKNFFALWFLTVVYAWIDYNFFGALLAVLEVKWIMFIVFPVMITSVASAIFPPKLGNVFYNISYMFPAHAYWRISITIFGRGICNRLHVYAPVLMAWIIVTEIAWLGGIWRLNKVGPKGRH